MKIDITTWLRNSIQLLHPVSETPNLDAQLLLAEALQRPREWILTHPEFLLTTDQIEKANKNLYLLLAGKPLPYITGQQEFYRLPFVITPDVLIPRPETELLVEYALTWLKGRPAGQLVADVGTGSGCIAISLIVNLPSIQAMAVDISWNALQVARKNFQNLAPTANLFFIQSDLLSSISVKFDLICANLPYIPTQTLSELAVSRQEPILALDGGPDGLALIKKLLFQSKNLITPDGLLLLEIEHTQSASAFSLAEFSFPDARIKILPDLADQPRLLVIQLQ